MPGPIYGPGIFLFSVIIPALALCSENLKIEKRLLAYKNLGSDC